jgi:hypothetical protein
MKKSPAVRRGFFFVDVWVMFCAVILRGGMTLRVNVSTRPRGFMTLRVNTAAGVYAACAATRPPNLFRRSAATFCRIVFYDLAAARRYTLGGRVDT